MNFVGDVGVLENPADTHTLGLVSALPEKRQRSVRRRLVFWKPLHQVHVTIGTTGETGAIFGATLRAIHGREDITKDLKGRSHEYKGAAMNI
jgi:hypothetical protein